MKLEINRQSLLDALGAVEPAVPKKSPQEILKNVRACWSNGQLELMATDQEVSVRYQIPATFDRAGCILIPAGRLRSILTEVTGSVIELETEGDRLSIRAGFAEFTIPTADPNEFPTFPENNSPDSVTLPAAALSKAIRRTIWSTDPENSRYALGGIKLAAEGEHVEFVATDSRRLAICRVACVIESKSGELPPNIVIPAKSMAIVERLAAAAPEESVTIQIQSSSVTFKIGSQKLFSRLVEGRFPRYQDVVPDPNRCQYREAISAGQWLHAIRQAQITTSQDSRGVDFIFGKGKLVLVSQAADVGSSRVELPLEGSGTDLKITLDPRFTADLLKSIPPETVVVVRMDSPESAVLFQVDDGAYQYVQMPLSRE